MDVSAMSRRPSSASVMGESRGSPHSCARAMRESTRPLSTLVRSTRAEFSFTSTLSLSARVATPSFTISPTLRSSESRRFT